MSPEPTIEDDDDDPAAPSFVCSKVGIGAFNSLELTASFGVLHLNIRSIACHFDELLVYLEMLKFKFPIIVLSEIWATDESDAGYQLPGYQALTLYSGRGGGIKIFILKGLSFSHATSLSVYDHPAEILSFSCRLPSVGRFNIVAVYKRHACPISDFNSLMLMLLSKIRPSDKTIFIGDFNICLFNDRNDPHIREFLSIMSSFNFVPIINLPTRVTERTATLIDHIWVNFARPVSSFVFDESVTDHRPIAVVLNDVPLPEPASLFFRDFSLQNKDKFIASFPERAECFASVNSVITDPEAYTHCLNDFATQQLNDFFPLKSKQINAKKRSSPWIDSKLINEIKLKHILLKHFNNGIVSRDVLSSFSKCLKNKIFHAKNIYFKNVFDNSINNMRKSWQVINNSLGRKTNDSGISELMIDGQVVNDSRLISDKLNDYFVSIPGQTHGDIPHVPNNYVDSIPFNEHSIFLSPADSREVSTIISRLKNSSAPDGEIPSKLLKLCPHQFGELIARGFNMMLQVGSFPDSLKVARVTPLFKGNDPLHFSNYRPISILPIIGKIYEKLLHTRFSSFIESHNIMHPRQFGFSKGKCTVTSSIDLINSFLPAFTYRKFAIVVFFDFSKAFDCVSHDLLLNKLFKYGFRGIAHDLIKSYLSSRSQYVYCNGIKSSSRMVEHGVPQGSTLGPFLFNLFVNDLSYLDVRATINQYADDTSFLLVGDDLANIERVMMTDVNKFFDWTCANKLMLNVGKTKALVFTPRLGYSTPQLLINDAPIEVLNEAKYLGLIIDNNLNFNSHINFILKKLSRLCGVSHVLSYKFNLFAAKSFYYGLFYSRVAYMIAVWGGTYSSYIDKIQVLQKRVIKNLFSRHLPGLTTKELFKELRILKINQIHKLELVKLVFLAINTDRYSCLRDEIRRLEWSHNYNTRRICNYRLPRTRVAADQHGIVFQAISLWNSLPLDLRESTSLSVLKKGFIDLSLSQD